MDVALPNPDFEAVLDVDGLSGSGQEGGRPLPTIENAQLDKLRGARPTAHKVDGWILCAAPLAAGVALVHGYRALPKGVALSDLIRHVESAARAQVTRPRTAQPDAVDRLRDAAVAVSKMPRKKRIGQVLYAIRDAGLSGVAALAVIKNGRVKKIHFAAKSGVNVRDELRSVILNPKPDSDAIELDLIARSLGGASGTLYLPSDPDNGLAFFGVDLTAQAKDALERNGEFFAMLTELNPNTGRGARVLWGAGVLAVLAAVGVYLAMPAPVYVSNFAEARASQSVTVALPFGAFLEKSMVRPGQVLDAGEVAAVLRSPEIENGIAEQKVSYALEQINAQDALNAGDYGEFQLAEKRAEIALLLQQQLESRQAQLTVTAPVASRVVTALPDGDRGNFLSTGTPVVVLQPKAMFDLLIDVSDRDSALVQAGQSGHVFFRGLSDETYPFETLSTATLTTVPETGETRSVVRARILGADQSDLLVGLSGFAKIETRTAPRIVGLTRPLVDYIRLTLWKTLGFTF
ncbi:hypothetical protein L0664_14885 [Octadecabacter sp. G9-8]|uniref:HlyD family efflux transporter periplasmic adaptor subunit n=1 Tax=Octadecabacter dasysiphoniae TaxID=2909341 RepID=A0ABS9D226_9RHOB|nr:hypothetical protein [Octadecabacter dasysiphoniae]MCF2872358.1 hypothetical protein [Octadecabacter dasysiphoniae]